MSALPWIFAAAGICVVYGIGAMRLDFTRWRRERRLRAAGFADVSTEQRRMNLRDGVP